MDGPHVFQGAKGRVQRHARPEVHVEVQAEPQAQKDVPSVGVVGHPGIPQGTQEYGVVVLGEGTEFLVRDRHPVTQIPLGSQILLDELEVECRDVSQALQHPRSLTRDLGSDSVSGDDGDAGHQLTHPPSPRMHRASRPAATLRQRDTNAPSTPSRP